MVGHGPPGTEQISQLASYFLTFLTRIKRRKMMFFEGYPVGLAEGGLGRGGSRGFGSGKVGGRGHGPQGRSKFRNLRRLFDAYKKKKNDVF